MINNLLQQFGNIDIYLFDQLLKSRFDNCEKIIDAGCGDGRNLSYFLQNGFQVFGIDQNPDAIAAVKALSSRLAPLNSIDNFKVANLENIPFNNDSFDLAICNAVLHFAQSKTHFDSMLRSAWRVIKPGGYLFARLASDIGIEDVIVPLGNSRYLLPDGSERLLVNQQILLNYTEELNAELFEPIKTTNVQNLRCMTTWCLQKK